MGIDAVKVGVEVDVSGGLPGIVLLGLPDSAVQESKERVKATLKNAGFAFPMRKIVINLTPADLRKEGPSFDLPISVGILAASEQVSADLLGDYLFLGEVSLDGSLRPVAGVLPIAATAQKMGIAGLVVPVDNAQEAAVVEGLAVYGCKNLFEVADLLNNPGRYKPVDIDDSAQTLHTTSLHFSGADLQDVKGQAHGRRALEIAAVRLRVHPDQIHAWQEFFSQQPDLRSLPELMGDATLGPGRCVLETELGSTDLTLETQLKEIEQGFFDLLAQRPKEQ